MKPPCHDLESTLAFYDRGEKREIKPQTKQKARMAIDWMEKYFRQHKGIRLKEARTAPQLDGSVKCYWVGPHYYAEIIVPEENALLTWQYRVENKILFEGEYRPFML